MIPLSFALFAVHGFAQMMIFSAADDAFVQNNAQDPIYLANTRADHSEKCGNGAWRKQYQSMMKEYEIQPHTERKVIKTSHGQGMNDRMSGTISAFYGALLGNRTFYMHTSEGNLVPGFESGLDGKNAYFIVDPEEVREVTDFMNPNHPKESKNLPFATTVTKWIPNGPEYNVFVEEIMPIFLDSKIQNFIYESNRGLVYRLFTESKYADQLRASTGIDPGFSVYCAFHFLFAPNAYVLDLARPYSSALSDPNVLKIGIQIRSGDGAFVGMSGDLTIASQAYFQNFFECANFIEDTYAATAEHEDGGGAGGEGEEEGGKEKKKKVLWFLMSDSISLRRDAKRLYGDKLITNTETPAMHLGYGGDRDQAMALVLSEVLTFALCDYFVISYNSGLGRLGAWLSENHRNGENIFSLNPTGQVLDRQCLHPAMKDKDLAVQGAGI